LIQSVCICVHLWPILLLVFLLFVGSLEALGDLGGGGGEVAGAVGGDDDGQGVGAAGGDADDVGHLHEGCVVRGGALIGELVGGDAAELGGFVGDHLEGLEAFGGGGADV